jgi:DNA-binding IclR family transcriptional regulator
LGTPLLKRLCDELKMQCNLVVRDGRSIVYVAKVALPTPFTSSVSVGTRLPAHATVLGRVLLGDLTLPQLRKLYPEEKLEVFSPATPRTTTDLFDMTQADRTRGFVLGEGFFEPHISSIAAPVRDHTGHIIAALGVTLGAPQIEESRADEIVRRVRETADEISTLLNYSPAALKKVVNLRERS